MEAESSNAATEDMSSTGKGKTMKSQAEKPLPPGYVCNACGSTEHAIYNCPNKVSNKAKKAKGNRDEAAAQSSSLHSNNKQKGGAMIYDNHKVIMTGLPFDTTVESLSEFLTKASLQHYRVKLMKFEDSAKCKGVAFVTFRDVDDATKSLELTGTEMGAKLLKVEKIVIQNNNGKKMSQKGGGDKGGASKRCYRCGEAHDPSTCRNPRICYRCKSTEHVSKDCPMKKG
jgi:hypothetical protein